MPFRLLKLALVPEDRELLHERIEARFGAMLEAGLVDEVRALRRRVGGNDELPALRAVGYRQVCAFLRGEIGREAMQEQAVTATRQYAKRQLTWLRSEPGLVTFNPETPGLADRAAACLGDWLEGMASSD